MRNAELNKWTGKVGATLQTLCAELYRAESFAFKIEDEVDEVSLPLIEQVLEETGARE